jgi:hypothetical protein
MWKGLLNSAWRRRWYVTLPSCSWFGLGSITRFFLSEHLSTALILRVPCAVWISACETHCTRTGIWTQIRGTKSLNGFHHQGVYTVFTLVLAKWCDVYAALSRTCWLPDDFTQVVPKHAGGDFVLQLCVCIYLCISTCKVGLLYTRLKFLLLPILTRICTAYMILKGILIFNCLERRWHF